MLVLSSEAGRGWPLCVRACVRVCVSPSVSVHVWMLSEQRLAWRGHQIRSVENPWFVGGGLVEGGWWWGTSKNTFLTCHLPLPQCMQQGASRPRWCSGRPSPFPVCPVASLPPSCAHAGAGKRLCFRGARLFLATGSWGAPAQGFHGP